MVSTRILAELCQYIYAYSWKKNSNSEQENLITLPKLSEDWGPEPYTSSSKILSFGGKSYEGLVFVNHKTNHLVIVHCGNFTHKGEKLSALSHTVLVDLFRNKKPSAWETAREFSKKAREYLKPESDCPGYTLIETGHSLGAIYAELNVCVLGGEARTFESFGIKELLTEEEIQKSADFKITTYLSAPNSFNTSKTHLGEIIRVFVPHVRDDFDLKDLGYSFKESLFIAAKVGEAIVEAILHIIAKDIISVIIKLVVTPLGIAVNSIKKVIDVFYAYQYRQHSLENIFNSLSTHTGEPILGYRMVSWPDSKSFWLKADLHFGILLLRPHEALAFLKNKTESDNYKFYTNIKFESIFKKMKNYSRGELLGPSLSKGTKEVIHNEFFGLYDKFYKPSDERRKLAASSTYKLSSGCIKSIGYEELEARIDDVKKLNFSNEIVTFNDNSCRRINRNELNINIISDILQKILNTTLSKYEHPLKKISFRGLQIIDDRSILEKIILILDKTCPSSLDLSFCLSNKKNSRYFYRKLKEKFQKELLVTKFLLDENPFIGQSKKIVLCGEEKYHEKSAEIFKLNQLAESGFTLRTLINKYYLVDKHNARFKLPYIEGYPKSANMGKKIGYTIVSILIHIALISAGTKIHGHVKYHYGQQKLDEEIKTNYENYINLEAEEEKKEKKLIGFFKEYLPDLITLKEENFLNDEFFKKLTNVFGKYVYQRKKFADNGDKIKESKNNIKKMHEKINTEISFEYFKKILTYVDKEEVKKSINKYKNYFVILLLDNYKEKSLLTYLTDHQIIRADKNNNNRKLSFGSYPFKSDRSNYILLDLFEFKNEMSGLETEDLNNIYQNGGVGLHILSEPNKKIHSVILKVEEAQLEPNSNAQRKLINFFRDAAKMLKITQTDINNYNNLMLMVTGTNTQVRASLENLINFIDQATFNFCDDEKNNVKKLVSFFADDQHNRIMTGDTTEDQLVEQFLKFLRVEILTCISTNFKKYHNDLFSKLKKTIEDLEYIKSQIKKEVLTLKEKIVSYVHSIVDFIHTKLLANIFPSEVDLLTFIYTLNFEKILNSENEIESLNLQLNFVNKLLGKAENLCEILEIPYPSLSKKKFYDLQPCGGLNLGSYDVGNTLKSIGILPSKKHAVSFWYQTEEQFINGISLRYADEIRIPQRYWGGDIEVEIIGLLNNVAITVIDQHQKAHTLGKDEQNNPNPRRITIYYTGDHYDLENHRINPNGDCLFNACIQAIKKLEDPNYLLGQSSEAKIAEVRRQVADFIVEHRQESVRERFRIILASENERNLEENSQDLHRAPFQQEAIRLWYQKKNELMSPFEFN